MRILVVEDGPSVAQVLAEVLRVEGHDVLVALDGVEALNVVETTTVDGVFLDLVMPGLDGLSVLSRIRSRFPDLPVVILSGSDELWLLYLLASGSGIALVFDNPSKHALIYQLVGRESLPNAISLNVTLRMWEIIEQQGNLWLTALAHSRLSELYMRREQGAQAMFHLRAGAAAQQELGAWPALSQFQPGPASV